MFTARVAFAFIYVDFAVFAQYTRHAHTLIATGVFEAKWLAENAGQVHRVGQTV